MQQRKVNYLGRTISVVGVTCDKEEVAALKDWPVPVNVKDVCSFLGTAKYCRWFCRVGISIDGLNAKESSIRLVCCLPVCFSSTLRDSNTGSDFWLSQIQMTHSY